MCDSCIQSITHSQKVHAKPLGSCRHVRASREVRTTCLWEPSAGNGRQGGRGSLPSDLGQDLHLLFLSIFLLLLPPPSLLEKVRYCPGFPPKVLLPPYPQASHACRWGCLMLSGSLALSFSAFRDTGTPAFICEANSFPCPAILGKNLVSAALNKHSLIPVPSKSAWPREAVLLTYTPSASHLPQASPPGTQAQETGSDCQNSSLCAKGQVQAETR